MYLLCFKSESSADRVIILCNDEDYKNVEKFKELEAEANETMYKGGAYLDGEVHIPNDSSLASDLYEMMRVGRPYLG